MNIIIVTLIAAVLSAVLYRLGGYGRPFDTKYRDLGCPLVALIWMLLYLPSPWWAHFIAFGLLFGALTTYWDRLFGYDNFYMHGAMCGLAYFPYAIASGDWWQLGARCVVLGVFMGLWCKFHAVDTIEEGGRGASIILTLPLLLI